MRLHAECPAGLSSATAGCKCRPRAAEGELWTSDRSLVQRLYTDAFQVYGKRKLRIHGAPEALCCKRYLAGNGRSRKRKPARDTRVESRFAGGHIYESPILIRFQHGCSGLWYRSGSAEKSLGREAGWEAGVVAASGRACERASRNGACEPVEPLRLSVSADRGRQSGDLPFHRPECAEGAGGPCDSGAE